MYIYTCTCRQVAKAILMPKKKECNITVCKPLCIIYFKAHCPYIQHVTRPLSSVMLIGRGLPVSVLFGCESESLVASAAS